MNDIGNPAWMEVKKMEDEKNSRILANMRGLIQFIKENDLKYISLSPYHNRVKNVKTGEFVDWWNTGKMRRIDGSYGQQGRDSAFLLQEIASLIK